MNRAMVEMFAIALVILLVIVLLLIALKRAVKDVWEIQEEESAEKQKRLDFLNQYSEHLESMKNQHAISDEDYKKELDYLDQARQEVESG